MAEVSCNACGGQGIQSIPHPVVRPNGEPDIEMVITTCTACGGQGKVNV